MARPLTLRHRRELGLLAATVRRRIRAVARTADVNDIERWWERAEPRLQRTVIQGHDIAAALGARYLRQLAAEDRFAIEPAMDRANTDQIRTSLWVTGPVQYWRHLGASDNPEQSRTSMTNTLSGSSERLILSGERLTVLAAVQSNDSIAGWRRITGATACSYCSSRGGDIVWSKATASFHSHDACKCTPEPVTGR